MAGDWIKMRVDLYEDPAVIGIAEAVGLDEFAVVGRLHTLWGWADKHTFDGNAASVSVSWINRKLQCDGFAQAMIVQGWLIANAEGVSLPKFDRHNGKTAKSRALTANRVATHKAKGNAEDNADGNGDSVTDALPREEKRREENKEQEAPGGAAPGGAAAQPGGVGGQKARKSVGTTLATYRTALPQDERFVPENSPIFDYIESVGLPDDFLRLHWAWFIGQYMPDGPRGGKKYTDWRKVFRNSLEGNWGKLWAVNRSGEYYLTTQGEQLRRAVAAKAAA